jgi:ArsR family transcriptional regulator
MAQVRNRLSARHRPETPRVAAGCSQPVDDLLDPALFKALGDPTRVRLLACIAKCGRACSVGEVAECCSVDLSVVSRHLQALARAGLVAPEREGRVVRYSVRYGETAAKFRALADAIDECAPALACGAKGGRRGCC